jgi:hypothetical protein
MWFSGSCPVVMTDCVLKFEVVIGWVVLLVSFTTIATVQCQLLSVEMYVTDYCVTGFKEIFKIAKIIGVTWWAQGGGKRPSKFFST